MDRHREERDYSIRKKINRISYELEEIKLLLKMEDHNPNSHVRFGFNVSQPMMKKNGDKNA
jgi:hypothetical protein